jgi:hypothetical protein
VFYKARRRGEPRQQWPSMAMGASALIAIKEEGALRRKTVRIDGGE